VYVRYGATSLWQKIAVSKPKWIATGRILEAILAAGLPGHPDAEDMVDLSLEWPGSKKAEEDALTQEDHYVMGSEMLSFTP
jgi:hypothetical protein